MFDYLEESIIQTVSSQTRTDHSRHCTVTVVCSLAVRLNRFKLVIKVIGYELDRPSLMYGKGNTFSIHHSIQRGSGTHPERVRRAERKVYHSNYPYILTSFIIHGDIPASSIRLYCVVLTRRACVSFH